MTQLGYSRRSNRSTKVSPECLRLKRPANKRVVAAAKSTIRETGEAHDVGNAIWLFLAVPVWYSSAAVSPFSAGLLSAIPALGILSLAIGVVVGIAKREIRLFTFLLLPAASQILVVVAGFKRGAFQYDANQLAGWINDLHPASDRRRCMHRLAVKGCKGAGSSDSDFHVIICILCSLCRRNGI